MEAATLARFKPKALGPGATIRLVAPASPLTEDKLEQALELLAEAGYRTQLGKNVLSKDHYLAGTDEQRAADLMDAFRDPEVDAIYCARGGYGCARLFPYLDLDMMAQSRKMFIGFSDITTLHLALNRRGLPTLHAPMALTFTDTREPWVYESFKSVLSGGNPIPDTAPAGETLTGGRAEGVVTGGCLCLLTDSIGTLDPLETEGRIVLIEDVDENPHRIDAMLTHLRNSGIIQRAAGIVVGEMTRTDQKVDEGIGGRPWREIIQDRLGDLGIPAIINFPFGHCKNMLSLPIGIRARMDADAGTLTYTENLCA